MKRSIKLISLITVVLVSLLVIGHVGFDFPREISDLNFVFLIIGMGIISSILAEMRIRRLLKIILFIISVFSFLFIVMFIIEKDISILIAAIWILGIGIMASVLAKVRIKRSIKIVSLITSALAFSGVVGFAATYELSSLKFAAVIMGIGIGILSTLVESRNKRLFYSSVIITLFGWMMIAVYQGYMHPAQIDQRYVVTNLESFYVVFIWYFFHNTYSAFVSLFSGPTILFPYLILSKNIAGDFPRFIGSLVSFYGYKGIILILGWLNAYPELLAFFLATIAGIRIALESFQAVINIRRDGFFICLRRIRNALVHEIVNTMPKVVALLLIAAVLETLWTQFWVNYWLQHIL